MKIDTFLLGFALATVLQSSFLVIDASLNEDEWEWIEDDDNSKLAAVKKLMSKRIPPPPPDRSKLPVKDEVSTADKICNVEKFMECAKQVAAAESTWNASPTNCDEVLGQILDPEEILTPNLIGVCRSYMETNLCAEQTNCKMTEIFDHVRLNNDTYPLKLITCYERSRDVCKDQSLAPTPFDTCTCSGRGCCACCCFNDDATVLTEDGRTLKMTQLSVGDRVLTADPSTGEHYFDEVITFQHRDVDNTTPKAFIYLSLADDAQVSLSPHHLIYVATKDELDDSLRNNQTTYGRPKFAIDVKPGDFVFRVSDSDSESRHSGSEVLSVNLKFVYSGLYTPLTTSGNVVVDGVLMSCYASVNSHSLAHFMWAPVRAFHKISAFLPLSFDWFPTYTDAGIHRYGDVLLNIASFVPFTDFLYASSS